MATTWRTNQPRLTGDEMDSKRFALELVRADLTSDRSTSGHGILVQQILADCQPHLDIYPPKHFLIGEEEDE